MTDEQIREIAEQEAHRNAAIHDADLSADWHKAPHEAATALLSQQSEINRLTRELIIAQEDDKISRDFLKVSDSRCAKAEELLEAFLQFDSEAYDRKSTRAKALVALKKRARAALPKAST